MAPDASNPIVLYDGVCGFCNRMVQFILKRDTRDRFRFATLQGEFARTVLQKHGMRADQLENVYLILDHGQAAERIEVRSAASLSIFRELGPFWRTLANLLALVPTLLRDWGYNLVARHRYRFFGKYDHCPLPAQKDRHKFLDT